MISLYTAKETNFTHNGEVVLSDCTKCEITEEFNGQFELEVTYPLDEKGKWLYLLEDNIIKADNQLFRIYRKTKILSGIKVNCRHITYDLLDNFLDETIPANLNCSGALNWAMAHAQYVHPFTVLSDISRTSKNHFLPKNLTELIMGENGIINAYKGEIVRDNFLIKLLNARGLDRQVLISYGKNIQGIEETLDVDGICTRMYPTAPAINNFIIELPERYVDSPLIDNYPHPKIKGVAFAQSDMPQKDYITTAVTAAKTLLLNGKNTSEQGIISANAAIKIIEKNAGGEKLTVAEKTTTKTEWNKIVAEKPSMNTQATTYFKTSSGSYAYLWLLEIAFPKGNNNIYTIEEDMKWYFWNGWQWKETLKLTTQKTVYDTAYNNLNTYITPLLSNMTVNSTIVGVDFNAKFKAYYEARATMAAAIVSKLENAYEQAQSKANLENCIVVLRDLATNYFETSGVDVPQVNYKIDFLELSKTEEYKNYAILERMYMGDTVTVKHSKLNINLKTKVIKIIKNDLTGRIEKIELGNFKQNIGGTISNAIQGVKTEILETKSHMQTAIDHATEQINSAMGGYVVKVNGELLIMDTENIMTAENVARWNQKGLGFSSTGYNGPYGTAITADGHIVANFIDVGEMNADILKTGSITSQDGKVSIGIDSAAGVNITGEALTLTNNNGTVVIDGKHNMFKIMAQNTVAISRATSDTEKTFTYAHGLGYKPAFTAFQQDPYTGGYTHLPAISIGRDLPNYTLNFNSVIRMRIDEINVYIDWITNEGTEAIGANVTYFLYKEVAF